MGSKVLSSKIAPRLAMLAVAAAFVVTPALAQQQPGPSGYPDDQYLRSDSGPPPAESGAPYNDSDAPGGGGYYNYEPGAAAAPTTASADWCQARYRSYDPSTGMYRGFDGAMHPCP